MDAADRKAVGELLGQVVEVQDLKAIGELILQLVEGRLVTNSASRYGFTSQEITRFSDGSFQIMVAPRARPGNWLPSGGADRYVLVLRLYDTPVGAATRIGREAPMPSIARRACP